MVDRVLPRIVVLIALLGACASADAPVAATSTSTSTSASTSTSTSVTSSSLQGVVEDFVEAQNVTFSIVVVDFTTGERAAYLSSRKIRSASLYKLFVARELLRRVYAGELDRDAPAQDGEARTIGDCIDAMITVSDNGCGAAGLTSSAAVPRTTNCTEQGS